MADLITSARAKYNIAQTSFTSAENTTISALVTAQERIGERRRKLERVGRTNRRASDAAERAVEGRLGDGDFAFVCDEIVVRLRHTNLRLNDVQARCVLARFVGDEGAAEFEENHVRLM